MAADISTAFLHSRTHEKVYIKAGPEFKEYAGRNLLVDGGLYGLKSSCARFHEHLSMRLRKMDFVPCRADFDLWMRKKDDHYEYVATYVDDVLAFSRDPAQIIAKIKQDYELKGIGVPEYYLDGDFHTTSGVDTNYNQTANETVPNNQSAKVDNGTPDRPLRFPRTGARRTGP